MPFDTTLRHLRHLLSDRNIERGDWASPIQILDASDVVGLDLHCAIPTPPSHKLWPPPISTSPLVPFKLQRAYGVQGSSPDSVQEERERATRSYLESRRLYVIATSLDRLSPLAQQFVRHNGSTPSRWEGKLPRESYVPASLDEVEDSNAPPYQAVEALRGGTAFIELQSFCPLSRFR